MKRHLQKSYFSGTLPLSVMLFLTACSDAQREPPSNSAPVPVMSAAKSERSSSSDAPNILFILTDNQAASLIGSYGNEDIATPNIDALVQSGVKFTNAFAVNGMCSPTRATLMTGLMPSQHGVHNWFDDEKMSEWPREWSAVAEYRTLPLTLKEHGYKTALIGKWHLGQPWQASIGYEHWLTLGVGHTVDFWNNTIVENGKVYEVKDKHAVEFFADKAIEYLNEYTGDKPFYLQLNMDGPYVNPPTNMGPARNAFYPQYENAELTSFPREPVSPALTKQLKKLNNTGQGDSFIAKILKAIHRMNGDQATRANIASQNSVVDEQIGRVLKALNETGQMDNTLIIFSSDQGNFYGQHGLWTHTTITQPSNLYEAALNIPLSFTHQGQIAQGQVSHVLVGQYDIPTTILAYAGIKDIEFENSPGKSFADTLTLPARADSEPSRPVFYEQEETRGIRTLDFAYWKTIESLGQPLLFNMKTDSGQQHNLAKDPKYQAVIASLDSQLDAFFSKYSNPEYDLWRGGVAKGSVMRPEVFKKLYGADWETTSELKPNFKKK